MYGSSFTTSSIQRWFWNASAKRQAVLSHAWVHETHVSGHTRTTSHGRRQSPAGCRQRPAGRRFLQKQCFRGRLLQGIHSLMLIRQPVDIDTMLARKMTQLLDAATAEGVHVGGHSRTTSHGCRQRLAGRRQRPAGCRFLQKQCFREQVFNFEEQVFNISEQVFIFWMSSTV